VAESSVTLPPEIGARTVPTYRIYQNSPDNRIVGHSFEVEFASDWEVVEHAKVQMDGLDIEVWDGPRVVTRLKSNEKLKAADRRREGG
jgi:hypothetical protein